MMETYVLNPKSLDECFNYDKTITLKRLNVKLNGTDCQVLNFTERNDEDKFLLPEDSSESSLTSES